MQIEHRGIIDARHKKMAHKGLYIATGEGGFKLLFKPGVNRIAPEDWAKVKDSPGVKQRLAKRHLVIHEDDSKPDDRFNLLELHTLEQFAIIDRTIDPDVLQDWKRRFGKTLDPEVAAALEQQIKAVTTDGRGNPTEPKKIALAPIRLPARDLVDVDPR